MFAAQQRQQSHGTDGCSESFCGGARLLLTTCQHHQHRPGAQYNVSSFLSFLSGKGSIDFPLEKNWNSVICRELGLHSPGAIF